MSRVRSSSREGSPESEPLASRASPTTKVVMVATIIIDERDRGMGWRCRKEGVGKLEKRKRRESSSWHVKAQRKTQRKPEYFSEISPLKVHNLDHLVSRDGFEHKGSSLKLAQLKLATDIEFRIYFTICETDWPKKKPPLQENLQRGQKLLDYLPLPIYSPFGYE